jgi:ssRNA-specific RNase YbeY (16S rRNA maturation enzyme)
MNKILNKRKDTIRADWMASVAKGWSPSVAFAHARCNEKAFRVMFKDDAEIQEIFKKFRDDRIPKSMSFR